MSVRKTKIFTCIKKTIKRVKKSTTTSSINISENDIRKNIIKLFDCYNQGYEPPEWTKKPNLTHMKQCRVFYQNKDSLINLKRLVKEREPVNIEMNRYYKKDKMNTNFGFKEGYYGTCPNANNDIIPPNFIVYTPTEVSTIVDNKSNPFYQKIHILNAIGLAFDINKQRDYKAVIGLEAGILGSKKTHKDYCKNFYRVLFTLIFDSVIKLKKKIIVMSLVGANNFATQWEGGFAKFQKDIWFPTFYNFVNETEKKYKSITIMFMGHDNPNLQKKYKKLGLFPQLLAHNDLKGKLQDTVLINAWDCWSVPGNGNKNDNSLDGYIGRHTQVGVNGTSLTNPYLELDKSYIAI